MVVYASGGPIKQGLPCEVVRQFFLVVAIEKGTHCGRFLNAYAIACYRAK